MINSKLLSQLLVVVSLNLLFSQRTNANACRSAVIAVGDEQGLRDLFQNVKERVDSSRTAVTAIKGKATIYVEYADKASAALMGDMQALSARTQFIDNSKALRTANWSYRAGCLGAVCTLATLGTSFWPIPALVTGRAFYSYHKASHQYETDTVRTAQAILDAVKTAEAGDQAIQVFMLIDRKTASDFLADITGHLEHQGFVINLH